ncbi:LysR family transcriptional regulator [Ensifer sp. YR511]|uniref:LysR family transcriptional regulator n=1 Tax=Ensifer sp. YR511 TaxID=1855294 RepID=UPI000888EC86|nr:LysR family transcriptional regulator [Ensifer sp. YR511]SDN78708.1 DNA-binding transcriptional regulator, LysR family [Ensifer sp. YR511]
MEILQGSLKLRQLHIFREVLRTGSTRKAATLIGISQPAVSQQIKQLESALGLSLFERSSNRMTPSRDAWEFLREVDTALTSLERLEASIVELKSEERMPVVIVSPAVFGFMTLPKVIAATRARTASSLRALSGSNDEVRDYILSGKADIGIARLPLDPRLFEWSPLATAGNVCIFQRGHRFSSRSCIVAQDLVGEAIIDIDPKFAMHQMNINALRFRGSEPNIAVEYDDHGHEAGFVAAGVGVSITNEVIAREYAAFGIETRPFSPSALYHYVAIWQKGRALSGALTTILEALVAAFAPIEHTVSADDSSQHYPSV